jgi:pyruvate kinase
VKDFVAISKEIQIDFIAVPLCKSGKDIKLIREALGQAGKNIKILAKIDSIGGIEGYEEILMEADGMIFQRNELQWEHLQSEKLIIAEKWAVQQANNTAKLFMLQSQILDNMVHSAEPARTEMTEISTATLDGTDSFILTHETSIGASPVEAVVQLAKGIAEAEGIYDYE